MDKGCDDITIGYWYYVGMHMALCHGPVDYLLNIKVAGRCAWGGQQGQGTISIDNPELFGGEDREGGVVGDVDVMLGGPGQAANTYLAGQLGAQPAYRQVTSIVLNQVNIGLNPYPKTWQLRARRTDVRQGGIEQWYKSKASIYSTVCSESCSISPPYSKFAVYIALDRGPTSRAYDGIHTDLRQKEAAQLLLHHIRNYVGAYSPSIAIGYYHSRRHAISPDFEDTGNPCYPYCPEDPGVVHDGYLNTEVLDITVPADMLSVAAAVSTSGHGLEWNVAMYGAHEFFNHLTEEMPQFFIILTDGFTNPWGCWADGGVEVQGFVPCPIIAADFSLKAFYNRPPNTVIKSFLTSDYATPEFISTVGVDLHPTKFTDKYELAAAMIEGFEDFLKNPTGGTPGELHSETVYDMNPAHIIRECLTDPDWGMGYPEADMDDAAFMACADVLSNEGMGVSLLWDKQIPLDDFVMEVLKHINAVLYVSRLTGKFVLKLIRDDYDVNTLLELNEDHIVSVSNAKRTSFGELVNSVTVQYWDTCTGEDASLTIADQALVSMQGNTINTTVQYPGFTNRRIASQVCLRDLRTLSTPLLGCTVYADRHAADLNVGDVFVMRWPDLRIDGLVMRVVGMAYGDGRNNTVQIQCSEDVFGYSLVVVAEDDPDDPKWEDPISGPEPVEHQLCLEAPYYTIVQRRGEKSANDMLADDPLEGYVGVAAVENEPSITAKLYTNAGGGYLHQGGLVFCASITLLEDIDRVQQIIKYDEIDSIQDIVVGRYAQLDGELLGVVSVDTGAKEIVFKRAVLDTCVRTHLAGARVFFWDNAYGIDFTRYVDGESISTKILPVTGKGTLPIDDATQCNVIMSHRAIRPYPPADMKAGGVAYPARVEMSSVEITWSHRDRLQQTDGNLYGDTEGPIGPEANTEYLIQVFDGADAEVINLTGIVGGAETVDLGALTDQSQYEMHLSATRDGYTSWQANIWAFIMGAYIPVPPIFTGAITDFTGVGVDVNYDCSQHFTTGGAVDSYSLQNAAAWLSIDDAGMMKGIANVESVSNVTVTAHNADGTAVSNVFVVDSTATIYFPRSTKWRINIVGANATNVDLTEIEMMSEVGGLDQCNGGVPSSNFPTNIANLFDNDDGTGWRATHFATWIEYTFTTAVSILEFTVRSWAIAANTPKDFEFQYHDGSTWQTVFSITGIIWLVTQTKIFGVYPAFIGSIPIINAQVNTYFYYDLSQHFSPQGGDVLSYTLNNAPAWLSITGKTMHGTPDTLESVSDVSVTCTKAEGNVTSNTFSVNSIPYENKHKHWRLVVNGVSAGRILIGELEMRDTVDGVDLCEGGIIRESGHYGNTPASLVFDNDLSTYWEYRIIPGWVSYEFTESVRVEEFAIALPSLSHLTTSLAFEYSDNGSDWTEQVAYTGISGWVANEFKVFST